MFKKRTDRPVIGFTLHMRLQSRESWLLVEFRLLNDCWCTLRLIKDL